MIINPRVLREELRTTLLEVEKQIQAVKDHAKSIGVSPFEMRTANGNWALSGLLAAKVQTLHALTLLNDRER